MYYKCKYLSSFDTIFFDRFFFLFCGKFLRKRGNSYSYSLEESCLHCEVFFWSEWFFWRSKSCTRGEEKSWKITQRGFSLTIHVLCFFLADIYIYTYTVWYDLLFVTSGTRFLLEIRKYVFLFNIGVKWQEEKWDRKRWNYRSNVPI